MNLGADPLDALPSPVRGYLAAANWAGAALTPADVERIAAHRTGANATTARTTTAQTTTAHPTTAAEIEGAYAYLQALSPALQAEAPRRWAENEPPVRIDDQLDLHWSWLPDRLAQDPPALIVFALREVRPELAKETLRALWSRLRTANASELEVAAPAPALAAHLRRRLFSAFALLSEKPRTGGLAALLALGKKELHLLVYDLGFSEITVAAGTSGSPELAELLRGFEGADATRLQRIFVKGQPPRPGTTLPEPGSEAALSAERRRAEATENVRSAYAASGQKDDFVGYVGLRRLAAALASDPRDWCRHLGQKMKHPEARLLLEWRDRYHVEGVSPSTDILGEITHRLATVVSRTTVPAVANRVWA